MASRNRLKVMVASSVYGFEETIEQLCAMLRTWGYQVLNSHIGTIPTDSDNPNMEDCLIAVRECDLFIGIVRTNMGTGNIGDRNITIEEIRTAIQLNKKRWFVVDKTVVVARQIINHMILAEDKNKDKEYQRNVLDSKLVILEKSSFLDPKSLDALNVILEGRENKAHETVGKWYHAYERISDIFNYIETNLGEYKKVLKKVEEANTNEQ